MTSISLCFFTFNFFFHFYCNCSPLGPFVPAPPEVAMRMMREQGGPTPFEGGRNGRSGPAMSGAAPMIALPPGFRQDPRRLRRYFVPSSVFRLVKGETNSYHHSNVLSP